MKMTVNPSAEQSTTSETSVKNQKICMHKNMFYHTVINYQHVSIAFAIIWVALQEY
jgi:hypothetical protein